MIKVTKSYGILFAKADIVSTEDICLMKKSIEDKLVDMIYFIPTPVLNTGDELYSNDKYDLLKKQNNDILHSIPEIKIWNKELNLFQIAKESENYQNNYFELNKRLKQYKTPSDILLDISAVIREEELTTKSKDDKNEENFEIKLLANSTLIYSFGYVNYGMWSIFDFLVDDLILDSLYVSAASDSFRRIVLDRFVGRTTQLNLFTYLSSTNLKNDEFLNLNKSDEKYVDECLKFVESFVKTDYEHPKKSKKTTIEILFEEQKNSFIVKLNEENELIPLTYSYFESETGETINQAINNVIKTNIGFDIDGKYAELLHKKIDENDNETVICYLNLQTVPMSSYKWSSKKLDSTEISKIKYVTIFYDLFNKPLKTIIDSQRNGHISKMLEEAVDILRCKSREKTTEINSTSELVTEKDAITTYQWIPDDNPFDFLNYAKLVISVTYQGFPNQGINDKTII